MSPDEEKQLRQLLRKSHQLPEPTWNLIARTTKRFSRLAEIDRKQIVKKDITKPDGKADKDRKK